MRAHSAVQIQLDKQIIHCFPINSISRSLSYPIFVLTLNWVKWGWLTKGLFIYLFNFILLEWFLDRSVFELACILLYDEVYATCFPATASITIDWKMEILQTQRFSIAWEFCQFVSIACNFLRNYFAFDFVLQIIEADFTPFYVVDFLHVSKTTMNWGGRQWVESYMYLYILLQKIDCIFFQREYSIIKPFIQSKHTVH